MNRREQLLQSAEAHEKGMARIRERFGIGGSKHQEQVSEWLLSQGAVPAALAAIALVVYLAVSLILGS